MTRCLEPGWIRIGVECSAGRRSLWVRLERGPGGDVIAIELCAGREGDDEHVRITPDNPAWSGLEGVLLAQVIATEI